jgi:hypothetical protein
MANPFRRLVPPATLLGEIWFRSRAALSHHSRIMAEVFYEFANATTGFRLRD